MRRGTVRLQLAVVLLAWLAQLCLPVAHAAMMATPGGAMPGWCGDPSRALVIAAELPAEIREALGLDVVSADHLVDCAKLCATGSAPPTTALANTVVLRAAGHEPTAAAPQAPPSRDQAPRPPSQGPPTRA